MSKVKDLELGGRIGEAQPTNRRATNNAGNRNHGSRHRDQPMIADNPPAHLDPDIGADCGRFGARRSRRFNVERPTVFLKSRVDATLRRPEGRAPGAVPGAPPAGPLFFHIMLAGDASDAVPN